MGISYVLRTIIVFYQWISMEWNIHSNTLFMWCNLNWWKEVMYSFMHSIILQDNIASDLHWPYFLPNRYWTLTLILITNGANKSFQTNVPTISIDTHRLDMPWIKVSIHAHRYVHIVRQLFLICFLFLYLE